METLIVLVAFWIVISPLDVLSCALLIFISLSNLCDRSLDFQQVVSEPDHNKPLRNFLRED